MNLNPCVYSQRLMQKAEMETFKKKDSFCVMQKAAETCFNFITDDVTNKKILVICGPGNNGGDGILIAKYLYDKQKNVSLYAPLGIAKTKDSQKALALLDSSALIKQNVSFKDCDIIIDSVFGIGLNRPVTEELQILFRDVNDSPARVIAIDIPSGVRTDTGQVDPVAIKADLTLTFHRLKPGHLLLPGKECAGTVELLDIQLENLDSETRIFLNTPPSIKKTNNTDHKYSRGTSYIIAGTQLIGASKLAALAASQSSLRSGAGVSKLFIAKENEKIFKPHILEEMMVLYDDQQELFEIIQKTKIASLIFGCGIDINKNNLELLKFLLDQPINLVLDASVFSLIEQDESLCLNALSKREAATILTPHKGEFERIFNITNDKIHDCINASKQTNSIILYKGSDTVIGTPSGEAYLNHLSSPHLATAGSGDVLAGLIGGLLAQEYEGVDAAKLACHIHSQCGIRLGEGLVASDLIKEIPNVLKDLRTER